MKRILLLTLLISQIFMSCDKDNLNEASAFVNVTVKESSILKPGVSVYMFSEENGPTTTFFKPNHASKIVITDSNGIATFNLQETFDLNVIDTQTTFYFGVFDFNDDAIGNAAVTIEKGQTKTIDLDY